MKHLLLITSLFLSILASAQSSYIVTGTVTDEDNKEPLVGASVSVKGTNKGTICDFDGQYQIEAKSDDILIFSYVGYKNQEIKCNGRTVIDVELEDSSKNWPADHPTRIYSSAEKKRDMTSAVTRVVERSIDYRATGYSNSIINGRVTGFYASRQGSNMFNFSPGIRSGIGNIGGETKYVVDGVADAPFNVADILSLEVVKGSPSVLSYTNSTAPGGILNIQTYHPGREGRTFEANAWVGVKDAIALLPNNRKKLYDQELQSALVQHYDIKFSDQRSFPQGPLNITGFVSYDKIEGTVRSTDAQRLTPRLTFDYRFFKWLRLNQMVYYDRQEQDNRWLYNTEITTLQNMANIRNELFSASTIRISPWNRMNITSTFSYDWIDTRGGRADQNNYYTAYRDYFDFRNQENSRTNRWMWDNSIAASHEFNYEHEVSLKAAFVREMTELKTKMPAVASTNPDKEWNRSIITNNILLQTGYNYSGGTRTLSTSIRRLSSSLLDKGNEDIYLPTITTGWKFTNERFMNWPDFLSMGRLKAGWGKTAHTSLYMPVTQANRYGYPDFTYSGLKWQTTEQTDAGIELYLLNNKLNLSVDYYYKTTNNILENQPVLPGVMHIISGQAKIINRGWEFSTSLQNNHYNNFHWGWSVQGNLAINNSSIQNRQEGAQLILGDYIAPKYHYGINGNIWFRRFSISPRFNGVNGLYLQRLAFASPFTEDYAKINYFTLGSLNVSYDLPLRFIGRYSRANIYVNAENLFYITNSSLKDEQNIDYVRYPVNRMFSIGFKLFL